jgi:hypothetical protein
MTELIPDRVARLDEIMLERGMHISPEQGLCVNELAAWLAGEEHTDKPQCVSPIIRDFSMHLNDLWYHEDRQLLKPYGRRMVGTAYHPVPTFVRAEIIEREFKDLLLPWTELASISDPVDFEAVRHSGWHDEIYQGARTARDELIRTIVRSRVVNGVFPNFAVTSGAVYGFAELAAASAVSVVSASVIILSHNLDEFPIDATIVNKMASIITTKALTEAIKNNPGPSGWWWLESYSQAKAAAAEWFASYESPELEAMRALAATQRDKALEILDALIEA